jgi:hypothetical protein
MAGDPYLFGLPVYTSPWMPDTMIVMGNRGGKTAAQRAWEGSMAAHERPLRDVPEKDLWKIMSDQLIAGRPSAKRDAVETTALGDPIRSWVTPDGYVNTQNVETFFRVGDDGRPEAVTRLVDKPSTNAVRSGGESELAWLKRRVDEICWRPRY